MDRPVRPLLARARPLVVAHRGASAYRPEHTLAAYELAARQGADVIEPDLVATRDGVLVARHESDVTSTTDVARHPELRHLRTTKEIDGVERTGWFTEDLTLAELRTLRAVERLPDLRPGSAGHDGRYDIPTFAEVLRLRERLGDELGREIGVYPETKHPHHFAGLGLHLEEPLVDLLDRHGLNRADAPVFVQSFVLDNLLAMRATLGLRARTVLLVATSAGRGVSDAGLAELALSGIDGIGPDLSLVLTTGSGGAPVDTGLVPRAHAHGLLVHPWTFRAENCFLLPPFRSGTDPSGHGDLAGQIRAFVEAGVDGLFVDHVDVAVAELRRSGSPGQAPAG